MINFFLKKRISIPLTIIFCTMMLVVLQILQTFGQTTLAQWTFEINTPADASNFATGPLVTADAGSGTATGAHTSSGTDWTTPTGNGSAISFSANDWAVNDYFQFQTITTSYENIVIDFDQTSSSTGPKDFLVKYSTDGVNFNTCSTYTVLVNTSPNPAWSAVTTHTVYHTHFNLSTFTDLNNQATIYFRLVNNSTTSAGGGTIASSGTGRIDNFVVTANVLPASEINITGNAQNIFDEDNTPSIFDNTDFDNIDPGAGAITKIFTIENTGLGTLNLTGIPRVTVTGTGFTLQTDAAATVPASGTTSFIVSFDPDSEGIYTGTVSIDNDDSNENPYNFSIRGTGLIPSPAKALHFDGINDYVTIDANLNNAFSENKITVECWVNYVFAAQNSMIVGESFLGDGKITFMIYKTGNTDEFAAGFFNAGLTEKIFTITPNQWTHIAAVYNGTEIEVFVNGVSQGITASAAELPDGTEEWRIGRSWDLADYFQGTIDEVRIWNRALCKSEIQNNMNCELNGAHEGLTAYYKFNQGITGADNAGMTMLVDAAENNFNGVLNAFALTGTASNWTSGNVSGTCAAYLSAGVSVTQTVTCNSGNNGKAVVSATGIPTTYSYLWTPGDVTTTAISNLAAGSYTCTISGFDGTCSTIISRTVTIIQPSPLLVSINGMNVMCMGSSVILTASGAIAYSWSSGGTGSTETVAPVSNQTYTVIGTDGNNCTATGVKTITVTPLPDITTNLNGFIIAANQNSAAYEWLNCNNGNYLPIAGATNQSYTATVNEDYAVIVTLNGCSDTSDCVNVVTLNNSSAHLKETVLKFYPNPNKGTLTFSLSEVEGQQSSHEEIYSIVDELGQSIQSFKLNADNGYSISIQNLNNGIYFIIGFNNNQMTKQKFIVIK